MAYQKQYRTIVPVELGADIALARWLARESFEKRAASDCLQIVNYSERQVPVDELPPKAMEQLGRPLTDYDWYEFSGVGQLDKALFDYLSAELVWRKSQARDQAAAEKLENAKAGHA